MPIISKRIEYRRPQRDGRIRVREEHTDTWGNKHNVGPYLVASNAEADANLAARDLDESLKAGHISQVIGWVERGSDTSTFDYSITDITEDEAEEEVLKEFARRAGDSAIILSWWPENLGTPQWNQLINRLGWNSEIEQRVQDRSIALNVALPSYNSVESV